MEAVVLPYQLPDLDFFSTSTSPGILCFVPDRLILILGQSNNAEQSIVTNRASEDHVTIMKRPSGGEAVLLSPRTLVISVVLFEVAPQNPRELFVSVNSVVINALEKLGVRNLHMRGISDVSIGGKKILGSSMYRRNGKILYHAVLNVSEDVSNLMRYLQHPRREPDYRSGRAHDEFVTSLHREGFQVEAAALVSALTESFNTWISSVDTKKAL